MSPERIPADPFKDDKRFVRISEHIQRANEAEQREQAVWGDPVVQAASEALANQRAWLNSADQSVLITADLRAIGYSLIATIHRTAARMNLFSDQFSRKAKG